MLALVSCAIGGCSLPPEEVHQGEGGIRAGLFFITCTAQLYTVSPLGSSPPTPPGHTAAFLSPVDGTPGDFVVQAVRDCHDKLSDALGKMLGSDGVCENYLHSVLYSVDFEHADNCFAIVCDHLGKNDGWLQDGRRRAKKLRYTLQQLQLVIGGKRADISAGNICTRLQEYVQWYPDVELYKCIVATNM